MSIEPAAESASVLPPSESTEHRLQLPRDTAVESVIAMVRNVRPEASFNGGVLDLGEGSTLVADQGKRGRGRWTLHTVRDREDPSPEGLDDSHGYGRAFPEGLPFGEERRALDLAWSLGRRLFGAVVTDSGARLEPHPCHVRDLAVVSPYALAPESFAQLLAPLEPDAMLDEAPSELARIGYSAQIDADADGFIDITVGKAAPRTALAALSWADTACEYVITHHPLDEAEDGIEIPDPQVAESWTRIYRRIGMIAGLLVENLGGYVIDVEGFLVDPADLI